MRVTKSQKVLEFIASSPDGKRFGEIQRFICEMNGINYDEREDEKYFNTYLRQEASVYVCADGTKIPTRSCKTPRRKHRGIWATNLVCSYSGGLLYRFCAKRNGKWVVVRPIPTKHFYRDDVSPRICRADGINTWHGNKELPRASDLGKFGRLGF